MLQHEPIHEADPDVYKREAEVEAVPVVVSYRICGLSRKAFLLVLVICLVVIAAIVGGALGGVLGIRHKSVRHKEHSVYFSTWLTPGR
jgi:hypothetical protein